MPECDHKMGSRLDHPRRDSLIRKTRLLLQSLWRSAAWTASSAACIYEAGSDLCREGSGLTLKTA